MCVQSFTLTLNLRPPHGHTPKELKKRLLDLPTLHAAAAHHARVCLLLASAIALAIIRRSSLSTYAKHMKLMAREIPACGVAPAWQAGAQHMNACFLSCVGVCSAGRAHVNAHGRANALVGMHYVASGQEQGSNFAPLCFHQPANLWTHACARIGTNVRTGTDKRMQTRTHAPAKNQGSSHAA